MTDQKLIPHLFRTEYSKVVAVLCKVFGLVNIQLAEDIAADTFLKATETWGLKGVPENPTAWLYQVAKNKAKDYFKREQLYLKKITPALQRQHAVSKEIDIDLSDDNIKDSQLQMLFAVCNPIVSKESQITLALRVLCGFGIEEIATALLTSKSTINKRLHRTKEAFRENKIDLHFPVKETLLSRLNNVLSILYLLFNEGYYSSTSEKTIKKDLCIESMRLLYMLLNYTPSNLPTTNALMALFCFHASRFEARIDQQGEPILYDEQDQSLWDIELIEKGAFYINRSSVGKAISKYHLEALIAYWHTRSDANTEEKWENILQLYNQLIQIEYSPVTALNRTYALAMADGKEKAIIEALKIDPTVLGSNQTHLYHSLLAELYHEIDDGKEIKHLKLALKMCNTENDKRIIQQKLSAANQ